MQELIKSTSTPLQLYLLKMVFTIKPHSEAGWEYACLSRKTTQFSVWNGWSFPRGVDTAIDLKLYFPFDPFVKIHFHIPYNSLVKEK